MSTTQVNPSTLPTQTRPTENQIKVRISNLRLRCIIGIFEWERKNKQDIILNIEIRYNGQNAIKSDDITHAFDYKTTTKKIITFVESSQFQLIEKLADSIANIVLEDPIAEHVNVRVDKPQALRFADSVSVETEKHREQ